MDPRKPPLLLGALVLTVVLAVSFFGLLATFEPLEAGRATTWRIVYGAIALLSVVAIAWLGGRFRRL